MLPLCHLNWLLVVLLYFVVIALLPMCEPFSEFWYPWLFIHKWVWVWKGGVNFLSSLQCSWAANQSLHQQAQMSMSTGLSSESPQFPQRIKYSVLRLAYQPEALGLGLKRWLEFFSLLNRLFLYPFLVTHLTSTLCLVSPVQELNYFVF